MTIETALYPNQLNASWPLQLDVVREGAGHIRALKTVLATTFPNVTGAVTPTQVELNYVSGVTSAIQGQFSSIQSQINTKGAIAGQTWTGPHVFPSTTTVGPLTPAIQGYLATATSDVQAQINAKGAIAGQIWGGAHNFTAATLTAQTKPTGTNTTEVATTAFVNATGLAASLPGQTGNAGKFITTDGTNASWADAGVMSLNGASGILTLNSLSGYGITDIAVAANGAADLDALIVSGMYSYTAATNAPPGAASGVIWVSRAGSSLGQIAIAPGGAVYSRGATGIGGTPSFSAWKRVGLHDDAVIALAGGAIDCSLGNYFTEAVSANRTFAFSNIPTGSYSCVLEINHTSGTLTMPAGTVFAGGNAPTFTTGKRHLIFFQRASLGTAGWYASALTNYAS